MRRKKSTFPVSFIVLEFLELFQKTKKDTNSILPFHFRYTSYYCHLRTMAEIRKVSASQGKQHQHVSDLLIIDEVASRAIKTDERDPNITTSNLLSISHFEDL